MSYPENINYEYEEPTELQITDRRGNSYHFKNVTKIEAKFHGEGSSEITVEYTSENGTPMSFLGLISAQTHSRIIQSFNSKK